MKQIVDTLPKDGNKRVRTTLENLIEEAGKTKSNFSNRIEPLKILSSQG